MIKFVEHRVADRRILRLIQKWLKAGVMEDGKWSDTETGTSQGAVISPLLANIYLHYVFDLWVEVWRKKCARGEVVALRYADDIVLGFQWDIRLAAGKAECCMKVLRDRNRGEEIRGLDRLLQLAGKLRRAAEEAIHSLDIQSERSRPLLYGFDPRGEEARDGVEGRTGDGFGLGFARKRNQSRNGLGLQARHPGLDA